MQLLRDQSRKHKFYQIDDEIISGVTLNSVYPDYRDPQSLQVETKNYPCLKATAIGSGKLSIYPAIQQIQPLNSTSAVQPSARQVNRYADG